MLTLRRIGRQSTAAVMATASLLLLTAPAVAQAPATDGAPGVNSPPKSPPAPIIIVIPTDDAAAFPAVSVTVLDAPSTPARPLDDVLLEDATTLRRRGAAMMIAGASLGIPSLTMLVLGALAAPAVYQYGDPDGMSLWLAGSAVGVAVALTLLITGRRLRSRGNAILRDYLGSPRLTAAPTRGGGTVQLSGSF